MLHFVAPPPKKRNKDKEDVGEEEPEENMNHVIGPNYAETTKITLSKLSEREMPFELIEVIFFLRFGERHF